MPVTTFGLCGGTGATRELFQTAERTMNWYPAVDDTGTARSKVSLQPVPGLARFTDLYSPYGPVRGLYASDGKLFAVGGGQLFQVYEAGNIETRGLGILNNENPVQWASSGQSLLIATGNEVWRDPGLPGAQVDRVLQGAISVAWIDDYYIALEQNTNVIRLSFGGLDGATWPANDAAERTGSLDRLIHIEAHEGDLWLFGRETIDVWYHAGPGPSGLEFPFRRKGGSMLEVGLGAPWSVARIDKRLYWLGLDKQGRNRVYRNEGLTAVPISNAGVEALIDSYLKFLPSATDNLCSGYGYHEDGRTFYVLTFPRSSATLVYDLTTNLWHERARYHPVNGWEHWRGGGFHAYCFGKHLVARCTPQPSSDPYLYRIYEQSLDFATDDTLAIRRYRITPFIGQNEQWLFHHNLRVSTNSLSPVDMHYYYDNASSPSPLRTEAPVNGQLTFRRLGRARNRRYVIGITDGTRPPMITDAYLTATPGLERS